MWAGQYYCLSHNTSRLDSCFHMITDFLSCVGGSNFIKLVAHEIVHKNCRNYYFLFLCCLALWIAKLSGRHNSLNLPMSRPSWHRRALTWRKSFTNMESLGLISRIAFLNMSPHLTVELLTLCLQTSINLFNCLPSPCDPCWHTQQPPQLPIPYSSFLHIRKDLGEGSTTNKSLSAKICTFHKHAFPNISIFHQLLNCLNMITVLCFPHLVANQWLPFPGLNICWKSNQKHYRI